MKTSILAKLMLSQSKRAPEDDRPPATPEGLRCLGCSHCGEMCNRACRNEADKKHTIKRSQER